MGEGTGRIHYMDAARAFLMMLGVLLHSAQVFNPAHDWILHSAATTPIAGWIVETIKLFRMPAFFLVAGFFCAVSLRRHDARSVAFSRLERLAVPLLVCALVLNGAQAALLQSVGARDYEVWAYLRDGEWVSHLWFLIHLLIYLSFTIAAYRYAPWLRHASNHAAGLLERCAPLTLLAVAAATHFVWVAVAVAGGIRGVGVVAGTFDAYSLIKHAPYFGFGVLVALRPGLLARFSGVRALVGLAVIGVCVTIVQLAADTEAFHARVVGFGAGLFASWVAAGLCVRAFKRYFGRASPVTDYLARASYTVYLVHHVLVVSFAVLFIRVGIGGVTGMVLLTTVVAAAALLFHHHFVASSTWLRYLLNGVRPRTASRVQVGFRRPLA